MKKFFEAGGVIAGVLLVLFAIGAIVIGFTGRSEVRSNISREAVVIPLTKRDPGSVRLLPNEKLEIIVPESQTVAAWLPELERHIDAAMENADG